jgi:hypothetical protein
MREKARTRLGHETITFILDNSKQIVYYCTVIKSFRCRETRKIFQRQFSRKFPHDIQQRAFMKLNAIDAATQLEDLGLPSSVPMLIE